MSASAPVEQLLERLEEVRPDGKGWVARCPAHPDTNPSLHVEEGDDGRALVVCRSHRCAPEDIARAVGLELRNLFPQNGGVHHEHSHRKQPFDKKSAVTFDYHNADGAVVFQVQKDRHKNFRQRRPSHLEPPEPTWIDNLDGVTTCLYRLPEVLYAVETGARIYITEGEKDADNVARLGLVATTAPKGASAKWEPQYTEALTGAREIIVLPDNDKPGRDHAEKVTTSLRGHVGAIRLLELPNLPESGDVSDWIEAGGRPEELEALANAAPVWRSPEERLQSIALSGPEFLERDFPKLRSLLGEGLVCQGSISVLYGVPGGGKTWVMLQAALALVHGRSWFGLKAGNGPARVGILELELHAQPLQERLRALVADTDREALGRLSIVSRPDLMGRVDLLADTDAKAIHAWCRESGLDLVFVDALNRVHSIDENKANEMGRVLAVIDDLRHSTGTAFWLLHHEPKEQEGRELPDLSALRGSTRLRDDPNTLVRLVKKPGDLRCLRFPKVNLGREPSPIWLNRTEAGPLVVTDAPAMKADAKRAKILEALEGAASSGGITAEALGVAVGLKKTAVTKHLKAMGAFKVQSGREAPRYLPPENVERDEEGRP